MGNPIVTISMKKSYRINTRTQPQVNLRGVSIITCTKRPAYLQRIIYGKIFHLKS